MDGEQAATTMRSSACAAMLSLICSWPGSEQVYLLFSVQTTSGSVAAKAATASVSTIEAMLLPHWQTKTPMRAI